MNELEQWLKELGLEKYAGTFAEMEVDFEILPELSESDLEKLGIPLGPRKKLLKGIRALSEQPRKEPESLAERRQLTVMFCDLVGSTALSEKLDPEDLSDVIRAYQECLGDNISRFDGTVARYYGDGALIYFGYPQAHEDDAERAIRAGLGMIGAIKQLKPLGLELQVRIGIATGPVVVGEIIGEGTAREQAVVGETPNLAARLQSLAEPNAIVTGNQTWRLAGGVFEYKDLGRHELKGFTDPVQAWQPVAERSIDSRFEATRGGEGVTPIVGRETEVEELRRRWQMASAGQGQAVVLSGEPGIGKSRLIQWLRDHIAEEPHTLMRYYCAPYHQNSALFPVITQIERAAHFDLSDDSDTRLDKLEKLLSSSNGSDEEAVKLYAALLSVPTGERYPPLEFTPDILKEKILLMLEKQFSILASRRPVLVIFEDLHWVDPSTLKLLERAISKIKDARVLMLITGRPEFNAPWADETHNTSIVLDRLDRDRARALIEKVSGGKSLPRQLVDTITAKADGVPLFIEELTKTVLEAGFLEETETAYVLKGALPTLAVPSTLQDSLMARLDRMASAKEIAQIGAVIGRVFSWELLAAVAPVNEHPLQAALGDLQDAELVFSRGQPPEARYTFKHALVQDAAYDSLLKAKRRTVHEKIAAVLEARFPDLVETEPELLAHHHAGAGADDLAIGYWQRAAHRALGRSAYIESVNHSNKGLELLAQRPPSGERNQRELGIRSLLGVASVATMGYAADAIAENYARSQEICEKSGDTPSLIPTLYGLWVYHLLRGHRESASDLANQLYRFSSEPDAPIVTVSARAITAFYSGDREQADDYLVSAMQRYDSNKHEAMAATFGDDADLLAHYYQYWNTWMRGFPDQAVTSLEQANSLVYDLGTPYAVATGMLFEMLLWHELRDTDAVERAASTFKTHASEQGFPFFVALSMIGSGWARVQQGETAEGLEEIQQGIANFRLTGARLPVPYYLHYLAEARLVSHQRDAGLENVDEALVLTGTQLDDFYDAELYRLRGELLLLGAPDHENAETCFKKSMALARDQNAKMFELRSTMSYSRLLRSQGNKQTARSQLAEILDWFTEGFETRDLKDARSLLSELS